MDFASLRKLRVSNLMHYSYTAAFSTATHLTHLCLDGGGEIDKSRLERFVSVSNLRSLYLNNIGVTPTRLIDILSLIPNLSFLSIGAESLHNEGADPTGITLAFLRCVQLYFGSSGEEQEPSLDCFT